MKQSFLTAILCFCTSFIFSQPFGNEWIKYDQQYFKIKVYDEGIYRIEFQTLVDHGVPLLTVSGANFQVFRNGEEIYLHTSTPGFFGPNDYIEFYAYPNDGEADKDLYADSAWQLNPYVSLFTDTAAYFLTWNKLTTNKRMQQVSNDLSNLPPKENYFTHEIIKAGNSYNDGAAWKNSDKSDAINHADFEEGEGRGFSQYSQGSVTQNYNKFDLSTPYVSTLAPSAEFEAVITGRNNTLSIVGEHHLTISVGNNTYFDTIFEGYSKIRAKGQVALADIKNTTTITFNSIGDIYSPDHQSVGYFIFRYPRLFNFENQPEFHFKIQASPASRKYLEISGFDHKSTSPLLYDFTNNLRIEGKVDAGIVKLALPASEKERRLFLSSQEGSVITTVKKLKKISFVDFSDISNQGDYLIITHPFFVDDGNGNNYVQEYADYRNSTGFNARVILIDDLYDQFAYGIAKHPLAIRRFVDYALANWAQKPEHFFLVGLAISVRSISSKINFNSCYVPSYGSPPSDNMLTATVTSFQPRVPVGRLAIESPAQLKDYMEKVKQHEGNLVAAQTLDRKAWTKQILHFGGGSDEKEQSLFRNYLEQFRQVAEDTLFGGNVYSFYKNSSSPIQIAFSKFVDSLVNSGVSVITLFGHSSSNSFDFSITEPEDFKNAGKYPVILANGCNIGGIHQFNPSLSKRFVLAKDKGAIGFLGTIGLSYPGADFQFSHNLYKNFGQRYYGETIGFNIIRTIEDIYADDHFVRQACQSFSFHGDPAIRINPHPKPDFYIDESQFFLNPELVSVKDDSFKLNLIITNIGRAVKDSFNIKVERKFPDGTTVVFNTNRIAAPYYKDTVSLTMATASSSALGLNAFTVTMDPEVRIDEIENVANNTFSFDLLITSDVAVPVYPYEFSIVSRPDPELRASTANPFAGSNTYFFEIDTTELFNSPLKQSVNMQQKGGILKWKPGVNLLDSTVYYWRVGIDSSGFGSNWHASSFIYIDGSPKGWNQSHFYQFKKDRYSNIKLEKQTLFEFLDLSKEISVTNFNHRKQPRVTGDEWRVTGAYLNGTKIEGMNCLVWTWPHSGVAFYLFDTLKAASVGDPYNGTSSGQYGNINCNNRETFVYSFKDTAYQDPVETQVWRKRIINFIDSVPCGTYIAGLIFPNYWGAYPEEWGDSLHKAFESLGLTQTRNVENGMPYSFFAQKCNPLFGITEAKPDSASGTANYKVSITGTGSSGTIESKIIGPAKQWKSLHWDSEAALTDNQRLELIGIAPNNVETVLSAGVMAKDTLLDQIDISQYSRLKLKFYTDDDSLRTPAQLKYWRILYDPLPDAALNPSAFYVFYNDTLQEGEKCTFAIAVENVTDIDMDSLLINFSLKHGNNQLVKLPFPVQDSLRGRDSIHAGVIFNTEGYSGSNFLRIYVNPDFDQPEQFIFNNIGVIPFYVSKDITNPLLDVTFDGRHILNGEIISAKPEIVIRLKDENKFLALDDTSLINLYVKDPSGNLKRYTFDNPAITFVPAGGNLSKNNTAEISIRENFTEDGAYELIVQAADKSSNRAGNIDYSISFEIKTKSTITHVLNYPNPFTTSTRFVFTLTGSEVPTFFKIQIMTVTGKVIKEITLSELGPLRIGNNITSYAWDGTDKFGDKLANGLYLYRVVARLNGEDIEHRNTSADRFFRSQIGKMYLLR